MCYNYKNKENDEGVHYEMLKIFSSCKYAVAGEWL